MIWYLLYPFRGTTEPPNLHRAHPLRRMFTKYGREASGHPVIALLISVTLATCLIYPFPFLYTNNFTNGSSNLPHHVWTAAQQVQDNLGTEPDVVMRSIWVHGSYMKALERDVLQAGLKIQDALLGPTINFNPRLSARLGKGTDQDASLTPEVRDSFHAVNGLSEQSWFFHSPLLYWSCSPEAIDKDNDIVYTINESSRRSTSVNVTLRHSIVFSGKRFEDHRLIAADALVITLIHKLDSPVGRQWERHAQALSRSSTNPWRMYPRDGRVESSQLYEFKFQPLSVQDDIFLGIAYGITGVYFLLSLRKLRALKSRFGLMLTVVAQLMISVMASFTICAILKIDLSRIPREAYPFVVQVVGLGNMFRLVNSVIVTPSQSKTSTRISEALGQTGHIALAAVGQNLLILWILSKVVAPGVADFCMFAAVALVFDFVLLLTFFVAVLSVEVRRMELSDSLKSANALRKEPSSSKRKGTGAWVNAVITGKTPISTRIAGTVGMVGFILVLQWHFFDNESPLRTLSRALKLVRPDHQLPSPLATRLSVDIHQARSPTAWLRMQDHETAREVIHVIKPNAHSYTARVYDPLIFVLDSSDRTPTQGGVRRFLPAAYDFVRHQSTIFIASVIVVVAAVSLLMNYLLWSGEDNIQDDDNTIHKEDPLLVLTTLAPGHTLDVIMLSASPVGIAVSVGLDRRIGIWNLRQKGQAQYVSPTDNGDSPFPVLAIAISDQADWIAILSVTGRLMLWNTNDKQWLPSAKVGTEAIAPPLFFFKHAKGDAIASLVLVWTSGLLTEINFYNEAPYEVVQFGICGGSISCAKKFVIKPVAADTEPILHIAVISGNGSVHFASHLPDKWESDSFPMFISNNGCEFKSILPLPKSRLLLAIGENTADLFHIESQRILIKFTELNMVSSTLQCFHSVKQNSYCRHDCLASFSLAYTDRNTGDFVLQTYSTTQEDDLICMTPEKCATDTTCTAWTEATVKVRKVWNPDQWQSLPCGAIVGVTKRRSPSPSPSTSPIGSSSRNLSDSASNIRRRVVATRRTAPTLHSDESSVWEAWTLSAQGRRHKVSLSAGTDARTLDQQLFVTNCGPITCVGRRSAVVGFGNMVKVITVGHERFDGAEAGAQDVVFAMAGRKKKASVGVKGTEMGRG